MKAIIPVAGTGAKLRPHTYTQPKALLPIAGKTILSFIVDQLHEAGIKEFIFIIGYLGDKIKEYTDFAFPHLTCHFVHQHQLSGTGDAIYLTQDIVGNDEIFVALGDTICEYDPKEMINSPYNSLGLKKVEDPRLFGVASITSDGFIDHVVEKPAIPKSNMALVGLYRIKDTAMMYSCLKQLFDENIKTNGEFTFTDALDLMIKRGGLFKAAKVKNWFDCGKKDTLLESNATLLKKSGGNVKVSHSYKSTIIIPPVSIAPNCTISDSIIGPHVAVGANTTITQSIVRDSIIGSYTTLFEVVLNNSLIGSDASIKGLSRSLNIGDNTEIDFG